LGDAAEIVIVGAGIAGASLAFELAAKRRVVLIEREDRPGYHSSGRSAAMLIASYGTDAVRALTKASRRFFEAPPEGFSATSLLSPRGYLHIAREDQRARLEALENEIRPHVPSLCRLSGQEVIRAVPLIDPAYPAVGLLEPEAVTIDDAALHQGYLKGFARRGGTLVTDADVVHIAHDGAAWKLETKAGRFAAPIIVNAAGGWGDMLASLAGVAPIGLQPKRRTAILIDPPPADRPDVETAPGDMPMVSDVDDDFYVKPEGAALMVSPADETPTPPTDAQPEDLDVAIAVDWFEKLTGKPVRTIRQRWAGLRSFVPDHSPVIGFDGAAPGFFWLVGQGGFGFMTAPGAAKLAAALIEGCALEPDLRPIVPVVAPERCV